MSERQVGDRVVLLSEVLADGGSVMPVGAMGTVIGFKGNELVVSVVDHETGEIATVVCQPWDCRVRK
jgi:hypothetical protein